MVRKALEPTELSRRVEGIKLCMSDGAGTFSYAAIIYAVERAHPDKSVHTHLETSRPFYLHDNAILDTVCTAAAPLFKAIIGHMTSKLGET